MRKSILVFMLLFMAFSGRTQTIEMIKGDQITEWKKSKSDTVYVINFWATWCKPCIEEMPSFERAAKAFAGHKVRFIMVSNDFKKQIDTKLIPYLREHEIKNQVYYMDEADPNKWIEKVDKDWAGTLPATLIMNGKTGKHKFLVGQLQYDELVYLIQLLETE